MKKSTLDSVELLIPLAADKIVLRADQLSIPELILPYKRRSRVRRILNRVRSIRRTHPHLFDYYRIQTDIYVVLETEQRLTMFTLLWPADREQWARVALTA